VDDDMRTRHDALLVRREHQASGKVVREKARQAGDTPLAGLIQSDHAPAPQPAPDFRQPRPQTS